MAIVGQPSQTKLHLRQRTTIQIGEYYPCVRCAHLRRTELIQRDIGAKGDTVTDRQGAVKFVEGFYIDLAPTNAIDERPGFICLVRFPDSTAKIGAVAHQHLSRGARSCETASRQTIIDV